MTNETTAPTIHHSEMMALKDLFKKNKQIFIDISENVALIPIRMAMPDHGFPNEELLSSLVSYDPAANGWTIASQVKIRKIEGDTVYSAKNTEMLLNTVKALMEKEYPTMDEENKIPFLWTLDLDVDAIHNEGIMGAVHGTIFITTTPDDLYQLLMDFEKFPEVELVDASNFTEEQMDFIKSKPNLLENPTDK